MGEEALFKPLKMLKNMVKDSEENMDNESIKFVH